MSNPIINARNKAICVSASAGTGKTTILVERILSLVQNDKIPISRILAITFTDKAARELKERLSQKLREKDLNYWEVETAYISTFHAFCSRVLRENCFQISLSPDFQILTEIPAGLILQTAVDNIIDRRLKSDDTKIIDLLEKFQREDLIAVLKSALSGVSSAGLNLQDLKQFSIFENVIKFNTDFLQTVYARIQQKVRGLQNFSADKPANEKIKNQLLEICANPFERERFLELNELLYRKPAKEESHAAAVLVEIHSTVKSSRPFFNYSEESEKVYAQLSLDFINLLAEAANEYSALKQKNNGLDFEDLQLKTLAMLKQKPDIAEFYRGYFAAIMVDEFQDTNGLQDKLIRQIARQDNLFIVGDWKQSIYLFRHADKELFEKYRLEIQNNGGLNAPLTKNYRCSQSVIDLTNTVCAPLLGAGYSAEKLQPGTQEQIDNPGEAKIIFIPQNPEEKAADVRAKEARYMALQLKPLIQQNNAVLLPKSTNQKIYTDALEAEGLPYTVLSGGAYYSRGEVIDALNFLQILTNPNDDIKLAAVLRSEMFSVSDSALFLLTRNRDFENPQSLFELLQLKKNHIALSVDDAEKLTDFLNIYWELTGYFGKLSVHKIVSLALEKTLFLRVALTHRERTEQIRANLQKLLDIAKDPLFEQHGLPYFVRYIELLQQNNNKESDAELCLEQEDDEKTNKPIKILNIHSAKGLQFDNVFVADIYSHGNEPKSNSPFNKKLLEAGIPLALNYKDAESQSLAYLHKERIVWETEVAERKRLFYVAITRAKKTLQVVTCYPLSKDKKTEQLSETNLSADCLETKNIGEWLRYLYQQNLLPENFVCNNPAIPPENKQRLISPLPTILPQPREDIAAKEHYELNSLTAGLSGALYINPQNFVLDYFYGFPQPAPKTHSQFNAKIMQAIGTSVHKAIELNEQTYINPNLADKPNQYLQKCLDNYYQSEVFASTQNNLHHFELDMEYLENNTRYYGRADLMIQTEKEILVYDFKTGEAEDPAHQVQVSVYANILQKYFPEKKIRGFIFYLHNNKLVEIKIDFNIFAECMKKLNVSI